MSKDTTLNPSDRAIVQAIAEQMMAVNNRNDCNASDRSTYGHLRAAIIAFVRNQTGVDIGEVDWNLAGNASWVDDIQAAIQDAISRLADNIVDKALGQGRPFKTAAHFSAVALAAHRLRTEFDWACTAQDFTDIKGGS